MTGIKNYKTKFRSSIVKSGSSFSLELDCEQTPTSKFLRDSFSKHNYRVFRIIQ